MVNSCLLQKLKKTLLVRYIATFSYCDRVSSIYLYLSSVSVAD